MLIKITEINKDESIGEYPAVMITGDRVDGKGEWSKKFFDNNLTLMSELDEFGIGETINVRMTKGKGKDRNGNPYWNIVGFEEPSDDLLASVEGNKGNSATNPTAKSSGASGYSKGTWNGRTGEAYDRSAAIYLAWDFLKGTKTEVALKKVDLRAVFDLAIKINNYIHDGGDGSDPLDPPEVD